eukprot:TRINITY_DN3115_c3_g1_i1.p1 TRINITY_DN3115_c3_g1~~TRINITY_DN3115_c3_g1_i1.p1  ORF type:complete len:295 (+),score=89.42 TRINITY_DN3115_c3_g1_i1:35-886(+)
MSLSKKDNKESILAVKQSISEKGILATMFPSFWDIYTYTKPVYSLIILALGICFYITIKRSSLTVLSLVSIASLIPLSYYCYESFRIQKVSDSTRTLECLFKEETFDMIGRQVSKILKGIFLFNDLTPQFIFHKIVVIFIFAMVSYVFSALTIIFFVFIFRMSYHILDIKYPEQVKTVKMKILGAFEKGKGICLTYMMSVYEKVLPIVKELLNKIPFLKKKEPEVRDIHQVKKQKEEEKKEEEKKKADCVDTETKAEETIDFNETEAIADETVEDQVDDKKNQ